MQIKKHFIILLVFIFLALGATLILNLYRKNICLLSRQEKDLKKEEVKQISQTQLLDTALESLRIRKDQEALNNFEQIIAVNPENLYAQWGVAEVLRRTRKFDESENILNKILAIDPKHIPSLISLSYIRYKDDKLDEAVNLLNQALEIGCNDNNNRALIYMMLGSINSRRSQKGWLFSKIKYGTQIKSYFLKAERLTPDLPEVHLGLGTFYLLAPSLFGGNLKEAIKELELAVKIAPDFATANARLAQAYKRLGTNEKYDYYINRVKRLDPENEVLAQIYEERRTR